MKRLRWGILSTSNFAQRKILPALQNCRHAVVSAIGSRNHDKAKSVATQFGIEKAYGSKEELLADGAIEVELCVFQ